MPTNSLEKAKDTILPRATAAVSRTLLQQVTESFKRLFKTHYESSDEIGHSPEWQEINKLFGAAVDTYVSIALSNRRKIRGDLFLWVKARIEANESAISTQHFGCDRDGYFRFEKTPESSLADRHETWRAQEHMGWMNLNSVFWVCRKNIAYAASVALGTAAIRIASGSTSPFEPPSKGISQRSARSQFGLAPIHSSAPLSTFEAKVGKLMVEARRTCLTKYLPQNEILKIAALLDKENLAVRHNLEREAGRMAEYNKQHPGAAIKSWRTALGHPKFRRAVRKRFSRAEEKYKRSTPSVVAKSAGTPRTTI